MSDFSSFAAQVLEIQIEDRLGERASLCNMTALINTYIERFGFVDVGEVDSSDFEALVMEHSTFYRKS